VNAAKVKRAQKAVGAETETEAIELALDFAISEYRKNRLSAKQQAGSSGAAFRSRTYMGRSATEQLARIAASLCARSSSVAIRAKRAKIRMLD